METVRYIAKALVGAGVAFAGAMTAGYADGALTAAELWTSIGSGLVGLGAVFGIRNGPQPEPINERRP